MRQILKYPCQQKIEVPVGSTLLKLAVDPIRKELFLWFLVDPKAKKELRYFAQVKTGQVLPDCVQDAVFIDTILCGVDAEQKLLWSHVWELPAFVAKQMGVC